MDISVLIPAYNSSKFIGDAIDSVLKQTYPVKEIIILNNGSTDDTETIVKSYANLYENIRYIEKPHGNIAQSRNFLLNLAKSDVVSFLDADDLWKPEKLKSQVEMMEGKTDGETYDMILCNIENFYDATLSVPSAKQKLIHDAPTKGLMNGALIRKKVFDEIGKFDESQNMCTEDVDWLIRAKTSRVKTVMLDKICYLRRIHDNNSSIGCINNQQHMIANSLRHKLKNKPKDMISVVIPAYNAEKYLKEAVESVIRQTYNGRYEIIIVNNGSTDNTLQVASELATKYPYIYVFTKNTGCASTARNMGITKVKGNFVLFHDADDILEPEALELMFNMIQETKVDYVTALARDFLSPELLDENTNTKALDIKCYAGSLSGCILFKKMVVDTVGFFDEKLTVGENIDYMLRVKAKKFSFKELETVTKNRRVHSTNTMRQYKANYSGALRKRVKEYYKSTSKKTKFSIGEQRTKEK